MSYPTTIEEFEAEIANRNSPYDLRALKADLRKLRAARAPRATPSATPPPASNSRSAARAAKAARWNAEKARGRAARERQETNGILGAGGYRWRKEDEESMDFAGPNAFAAAYGERSHVWLLLAPDGREVSVRQAMEELAAGGTIAAQQWLAEHEGARP